MTEPAELMLFTKMFKYCYHMLLLLMYSSRIK